MSSILAFRPRSTVLATRAIGDHRCQKVTHVRVGALVHANGDQYKDSNGNIWTYEMVSGFGWLDEAIGKVRASTPGYGGIKTDWMADSGPDGIDAYIDAFALNEKNALTGNVAPVPLPTSSSSMFSTPVIVGIVVVIGLIGYKILA